VPPQPGDAAAAQALVEDFQAGVRRAQDESAPGGEADGSGRLSRRVPGATLDSEPTHARRTGRPEPVQDPETVRDLVEAFEAGVVRALREARPTDQHREGTS
jgi:hypothetical protein